MIFSGLVPSKLKDFSNKFNGSICAYRVFYIPIFRRIEGGGGWNPPPPRSLWYRKKRGYSRKVCIFLKEILHCPVPVDILEIYSDTFKDG